MSLLKPRISVLRYIAFILIFTCMSGCSLFSGPSVDPKRNDVAIVFGYIDMEEAPSSVDWVKLKRYRPLPNYWYTAGVEDGLFFHIGIDLGSFQVETFGNDTVFVGQTKYIYNFGTTEKNQTAIRIKNPGVYYLGSYKYQREDSKKWFAPDKFSMHTTKKPNEKVLLGKLLEILKSDYSEYTNQIAWVKQRIAKL